MTIKSTQLSIGVGKAVGSLVGSGIGKFEGLADMDGATLNVGNGVTEGSNVVAINDGIKVLEFLLLVIDKSLNTTSVPVDPKQTHCVSKYIPSILPSSKSTIRNENKINLIF